MKPAVLHVYRTYFPDPPGGLQEAIRQIALATTAQGVANTIYTLSPQPAPHELQRPEARVVRRRSWMAPASCDMGGPDAFATYARLARAADVVHLLHPWPFADLMHATVRPDRPAVMTYISDVVRQRYLGAAYAPLMWRTLRNMRVVVANAPAYARTSPVLSHPDVRDKVRVIPLGIDETSYPSQADPAVLTRLGLDDGAPYFLFIGVLRYYKGAEFLVRAAQQLGARVVIAGTGPKGDSLRALAAELGTANVLFAGQVSDAEKVALLQRCTALVLPSHLRSEAYGMVLVEAAMYGRPMISCEIGTGTSYVNAHGVTGLVVAPESVDELRRAMQLLLADSGFAAAAGKAARARYEQLFSGPALGRAYAGLFRELAA